MKKVLIIDDEEKLRSLLARIVGLEGFGVEQAADCRSALKKLAKEDFDAVLCDVKLPDGNGVDLVRQIKEKQPNTEIILLTAYGNIADGVQAIKNGAFDYITKGDDNNRIVPLLHRAIEKSDLQRRLQHLEQRFGFEAIIGKSKPLLSAIELAKKVAATDATVLLTGETGTGKEVFAQAIHQAGSRAKRNFVAINCAAFSKELLESELFGYKAGAFTGANKDKKGLFEEAHQGTIFLDEIGEMAFDLQAKLLRVLETGELLRVGESSITKINVRLIAATNRNLLSEIEKGNFRQDLFYRLSVFELRLPALRERPADIELLAQHFARHFAEKTHKNTPKLAPDFLAALQKQYWKGNIRELKNCMERSLILLEGEQLQAADLPYEMQLPPDKNEAKNQSSFDLAEAEKQHIRKVLHYTQGNKAEAARLLNIALTTLYRKLEESNHEHKN